MKILRKFWIYFRIEITFIRYSHKTKTIMKLININKIIILYMGIFRISKEN